jgi:ABC-type uncharacterized transport system substrate-binding protein
MRPRGSVVFTRTIWRSLLMTIAVAISNAWGQGQKVVTVGILTDAMTGFLRDGLRDLGYVEGKGVIFEVRAAKGDPTRVSELNRELVGLKPDLLLCVADACRHENGDIPMLFVQVGDPIDHGLVRSIARPGETSRASPIYAET